MNILPNENGNVPYVGPDALDFDMKTWRSSKKKITVKEKVKLLKCRKVLRLMQNKWEAKDFMEPVDWKFLNLLDNRDIIKHDRTVGPLIGQKQLKRRMRKSAVTLTALSYNHIIKTIGWFILQIDPSKKSVRYTWGLLADCTFAIEATVEAISVHETRQIFKETLYKFFPFFASVETMWRTRFPESSA